MAGCYPSAALTLIDSNTQYNQDPLTHPVDVVVDQLVCVPGPGLEVLHHVPVVGAAVLVLVVARPAVGRDAVHPEGVAHPRVGALVALVLVLVQTLAQNLTK